MSIFSSFQPRITLLITLQQFMRLVADTLKPRFRQHTSRHTTLLTLRQPFYNPPPRCTHSIIRKCSHSMHIFIHPESEFFHHDRPTKKSLHCESVSDEKEDVLISIKISSSKLRGTEGNQLSDRRRRNGNDCRRTVAAKARSSNCYNKYANSDLNGISGVVAFADFHW